MAGVSVGGVDLTMSVSNTTSFTGTLTSGAMLGTTGSMWINTSNSPVSVTNHTGIVNGSYGGGGIGSISASAASKYYNNKANITVAGKGFCIAIDGEDGEEIVRLRNDGKVVWKNGVQLDEGVKAFSSLLRLGVAESAGVGASVREEIRNQIYADLIAMAKEKGSLTEEDLTFDRDSCILVEKLAKPTTKE
jgi:hypothetical protein